MAFVDSVGFVAGALTTAAFVPQVIKTWKDKSAKDLSLVMLIVFVLGVSLWVVYGVVRRDLPIILPNVITLVLSSTILGFKIRYD